MSEELLTRKEVARHLNTTYARVRSLHASGVLQGEQGPDGKWRYPRSALEGLRVARPKRARGGTPSAGEIAARAYEMFEQGRTEREVVIALRVTPERAHRLRLSFAGPEAVILTPAVAHRVRQIIEGRGWTVRWAELEVPVELLAQSDEKLIALQLRELAPAKWSREGKGSDGS